MLRLKRYHKTDLETYTRPRPGETKLGEVLVTSEHFTDHTRYVLIGIPEDIGVRANLGTGGAHTAWPAFLEAFLNMQSTAGLDGGAIGVLGHLDCSGLMDTLANATPEALRPAVEQIDRAVADLVFEVSSQGKFPIVIGGGHNNAFPIIKGISRGLHAGGRIPEPKLNVVNLDAHADFRRMEGRHSGNGFRYAFQEGYLDRYAVLGLHRSYNSRPMLEEMAAEERILYTFWEEIFLQQRLTFEQAIEQAFSFTAGRATGIELDLDSIASVLSSAMSPAGLSPTQARRYIHLAKQQRHVVYLHICEGATRLSNGIEDRQTGKLIAYLVSDFLRRDVP